MDKIKAGVIGTGFIGPVHIEALRRLGFVEVAALADINREAAEAKASQLGVEKAYGDYRELIADSKIETVHICAPNCLHYEMARAAIKAGKHVICDKPLALDSREGEELVMLGKKAGVVCAVNFNVRFYPLVREIRDMIAKGELGTIFTVNGSYEQDWLQKKTDYSWRLEPEQSGDSRAIADIGSHWLDSAEYMTGLKIKRVCADFATFFPTRKKPLKPVETYSGKVLMPQDYEDVPVKTEDYASVLLRFSGGVPGSLTVNQAAAGRKNRIFYEIYGSRAGVCFDSERPNELWIGRRDGNNELMIKDPSLVGRYAADIISYPGGHNEGFPDTFKQSFKSIYTYILNGGSQKNLPVEFATFEDGLRELKLCESIVSSARQGKWLEV